MNSTRTTSSSGLIGIDRSTSDKWAFPHKKTSTSIKHENTLDNGFRKYYSTYIDLSRISDVTKKHFRVPPPTENLTTWRYSVRMVPPPSREETMSRRKLVSLPERSSEDRMRGKARVLQSAPSSQQVHRHVLKRVYNEEGQMVIDARSKEASMESLMDRHSRVTDTRNGIPMALPGDKPYGNPVYSVGFFVDKSAAHDRSYISPFDPVMSIRDKELLAAKKKNVEDEEVLKERQLVRELDDWMPPAVRMQIEKEKEEEKKRLEEESKKKGRRGATPNNKKTNVQNNKSSTRKR